MNRLMLLCVLALPLAGAEFAQPRVEAGVLLGGIKEHVLHEYPVIAGGRVTVRAYRFIDAEAEVSRYPIGGEISVFPATQALFGVRAGRRLFGGIGLYGKLRPGFIRFDANNPYVPKLGTQPALDVGGILEFYSRKHVAVRFDCGDTVVWYGSDVVIPLLSGIGASVTPRTRNQLQWSIGLSIWF